MTTQELQALEERCHQASPPPWKPFSSYWTLKDGEDRCERGVVIGEGIPSLSTSIGDAQFVANVRDDLPFLLGLVQRLLSEQEPFLLSAEETLRCDGIRKRAGEAARGDWRGQMEQDSIVIYNDEGSWVTTVRKGQQGGAMQMVWNAAFVVHCKADTLRLLAFLKAQASLTPDVERREPG